MSSKPMPWLAIRSQADRHAVLLQLSAALRSLATCRISTGRRPAPRLASSRSRSSAKGATVDATFSRVPDLGFFGIGSPFETALARGSASGRPPFLGTRTGRCKVHAGNKLMVMETQAAHKGQAKVTWRDSATLSEKRDRLISPRSASLHKSSRACLDLSRNCAGEHEKFQAALRRHSEMFDFLFVLACLLNRISVQCGLTSQTYNFCGRTAKLAFGEQTKSVTATAPVEPCSGFKTKVPGDCSFELWGCCSLKVARRPRAGFVGCAPPCHAERRCGFRSPDG